MWLEIMRLEIKICIFSAVLPACTSFHDVLWAHFKTLLDQDVERELCDSMLPPSYWKDILSLQSVMDAMGMKNVDN